MVVRWHKFGQLEQRYENRISITKSYFCFLANVLGCPVPSTLQTAARADARELLLMSQSVRTLTGRGEGLAPGPQGVEHRLVLVPGEQDRRVRLRGAVVAAAAAAASVRPSGRGVSGRHPHEIRLFGAGSTGFAPVQILRCLARGRFT